MRTPPGWGHQPAAPPRTGLRIPRPVLIVLVAFTAALMTGLLAKPLGWLAFALTLGLLWVAVNRGQGFRTAIEWVAVAALALILAGFAPSSPQRHGPPLKVDAAQTDQLEQARNRWADAFQDLATGYSRWKAEWDAKKEAR